MASNPKVKKATPALQTKQGETYMQPHDLVLSPTIQSAVGIHAWGKFLGEIDLGELIKAQRVCVKEVQDGDMRLVDAMLYGQAVTLETIFTSLARRAASNDGLKQFQVNMTLALKAQAQCRATLEALAEIKNPRPIAFVKQANISNGPQQVNNGSQQVSSAVSTETEPVRAGTRTHAKQIAGQQNELLGASHGFKLDTRAQSTAGGADPHLEAVAAGHRAAHP